MRVVFWLLVASVLVGCGGKLKRLSDSERAHYYALRVYMDHKEEKQFLKGKTEEERSAWLQERGLWDRFYEHDEAVRDLIVAGEVGEGWTEEMVLMSWGAPFQRRRMTGRPAERSEVFVYRFEIDKEGIVRVWDPKSKTAYKMVSRYQVELFVDDGEVTEMRRKDRWE
jgi:hypothetical protein